MKKRYTLIPGLAIIAMIGFGGTVYFVSGHSSSPSAVVESSDKANQFITDLKQSLGTGSIGKLQDKMKSELGQDLDRVYLETLCTYFQDTTKLDKFTNALYSQVASLGSGSKPYKGSLFYLDRNEEGLIVKVHEGNVKVLVKADNATLNVDSTNMPLMNNTANFKSLPKNLKLSAKVDEFKDEHSLDMIDYFCNHNKIMSDTNEISTIMFKTGYGEKLRITTNIPKAEIVVNGKVISKNIQSEHGEEICGLRKGDQVRLRNEQGDMSTMFIVDGLQHSTELVFGSSELKGKQVMGLPQDSYNAVVKNTENFLNTISASVVEKDPMKIDSLVESGFRDKMKEQINILLNNYQSVKFSNIQISTIEQRNGYYVVNINSNLDIIQGELSESKPKVIQINITSSGEVAYFDMQDKV